MRPARQADPFTVLGLPAGPGLTDDEVRAAWRRVAAATHPDRADGGDAARFAAAAAAYTTIRTGFGRTEALADLARPAGVRRWKVQVPGLRRYRRARAARREARHPGRGTLPGRGSPQGTRRERTPVRAPCPHPRPRPGWPAFRVTGSPSKQAMPCLAPGLP